MALLTELEEILVGAAVAIDMTLLRSLGHSRGVRPRLFSCLQFSCLGPSFFRLHFSVYVLSLAAPKPGFLWFTHHVSRNTEHATRITLSFTN